MKWAWLVGVVFAVAALWGYLLKDNEVCGFSSGAPRLCPREYSWERPQPPAPFPSVISEENSPVQEGIVVEDDADAGADGIVLFSSHSSGLRTEQRMQLHEICRTNPFANCPTPRRENGSLRIEVVAAELQNCAIEIRTRSRSGASAFTYDIGAENLTLARLSDGEAACSLECALMSYALVSAHPGEHAEAFSDFVLVGHVPGISDATSHPITNVATQSSLNRMFPTMLEGEGPFLVPVSGGAVDALNALLAEVEQSCSRLQ